MDRELDFPSRRDETEAGDPPAGPVVVVQYRRAWFSTVSTPLLILVAAGAVLSHRVRMDDWRGLLGYLSRSGASRPAVARQSSRTPTTPVALAVPDPIGAVGRSAPPSKAGTRPPEPPGPRFATPLPVVVARRPIRLPESSVQASTVWQDIRQEAARTQGRAVAMEAVKAREAAEIERLAPLVQNGDVRHRFAGFPEDREAFRNDLRLALAEPPGRAGRAIRDLCDRHGVWVQADPRPTGAVASSGFTASGRRDRIQRMRDKGMSEAGILDDLIRLEARNRVARSGPKSQEEVLVRASKNLLAVPIRRPTPPPRRAR